MTATLVVPAALRSSAGGLGRIPTAATTVAAALDQLALEWPQLERRLRDERGQLRRHVKLYLEADDISDLAGMATPLPDGSRLHIIPAVSGGAR
ncbi:MAG: MoaD/ThiS family protein [Candidatus Dormibacteria bacterium]